MLETLLFYGSILGGVLVLVAFVITNARGGGRRTMVDEWCNLTGAALLLAYALTTHAWAFVLTNAVWTAWSIVIIARTSQHRV